MSDRYLIRHEDEAYVLEDRQDGAEATVEPARGNNVIHFRVQPQEHAKPVDVFLPPEATGGRRPNGYGAGNPILFPFPNRVRGGTFTFEGRTYQLDVNEHARGNHIHGLVSDQPWRTDDCGATPERGAWLRASIDLAAVPDVARQYPFPCRLVVTTTLATGVLTQQIEVHNVGPGRLPMGFGTHPWFPAALGAAERSATEVLVPGRRYWELDRLVPTGRTIAVYLQPEQYDLRRWTALGGREYDDVFTDVVRRADGWSEAGIRFPDAGVEIVVEASPEFREWLIYAPSERAVICLEPYTGATDAVNLQSRGVDAGLIVLEPGATWRGTIRTSQRRAALRAR